MPHSKGIRDMLTHWRLAELIGSSPNIVEFDFLGLFQARWIRFYFEAIGSFLKGYSINKKSAIVFLHNANKFNEWI